MVNRLLNGVTPSERSPFLAILRKLVSDTTLADNRRERAAHYLAYQDERPRAVMPLTKFDDGEGVSLSNNAKFLAIIERSRAGARTQGTMSLVEVRLNHGLPTKSPRRRRVKRR
jgi:hypothetical protein